jgi:hypothetical protein
MRLVAIHLANFYRLSVQLHTGTHQQHHQQWID